MNKIFLAIALTLIFAACKKEKRECPSSIEKTFTESGFNRITAGDNFTIQVSRGTAFQIKAKGCSNDLDDLILRMSQGTLEFRYNQSKNDRYPINLEVTMPLLTGIQLNGAAKGNVKGFGNVSNSMRVVVSGAAFCTVEELPVLVAAEVSGSGELHLHGTTSDMMANLSGGARLFAYGARADEIDVATSGTAKAHVQVGQSLIALATGDSRIYYKGNPSNLQVEKSGTAQVIRE